MPDHFTYNHTSARAPPDFAIKRLSGYNLASPVDRSTTNCKHEHLALLIALFLTQTCILVCLESCTFGWYVVKRSVRWAQQ